MTHALVKSVRAAASVVLALLAATSAGAQHREGQRLPATPDRPDVIYWNHCSVCHGEKGDGQSFARHSLKPPPQNFTDPKFRKESSRAHMIETVRKGAKTKEGDPTAMIKWTGRLDDKRIEAVVDYIIVKFMAGERAPDSASNVGHEHHGHDHSHVKQVDYPFGLKPSEARGKSLYGTLCARCHGANGDGKGLALPGDINKPRNFRAPDFREFANGFTMFSAVSRGHGEMPEFGKILARQDIADVSEYVLKAFVKPRGAAAPHKH